MKNHVKKIIAGSLVAVLTVTMSGIAWNDRQLSQVKAAKEDAQALEKAATEALEDSSTDPDTADSSSVTAKEETVYVKADASGKVTKTTVSEWLKNPGKGTVSDKTELSQVKNVKGDETFEKGQDHNLSWQAEGKDIYYQGTTKKELPVSAEFSYKLDGSEISASDLKGKDGKLEIHITYKNNSKTQTEVNGEQVEMYTPFTMVTAMMLPTDNYKNIAIDNGRIISDADKNMVLGLGFPRLKENLNLQDTEVDIPDSVTITADVTDASIGDSITVVSAEIMEEFGLNDISDFDSFGTSIDELANASDDLKVGADALASGTSQVKDGAGSLQEGAGELKSGIDTAKSGADALAAGYAGDEGAVAGAQALEAGLAQLKAAVEQNAGSGITSQQIAGIAAQAAETAVSTAEQQVGTIPEPQRSVEVAVNTQVFQAVLTNLVGQVDAGIAQSSQDLNQAVGQLQAGAGQLWGGLNQLYNGTVSLQSGLSQLSSGSAKLTAGAGDLYKGASDLKSGADTLAGGMGEFKSTGMDKLVEVFNGDIHAVTSRIHSMSELGSAYQSFGGIRPGMTGTTKFVIETKGVK